MAATVVAETGMGWREALGLPDTVARAVFEKLEEREEREVARDEARFEALSEMFGG